MGDGALNQGVDPQIKIPIFVNFSLPRSERCWAFHNQSESHVPQPAASCQSQSARGLSASSVSAVSSGELGLYLARVSTTTVAVAGSAIAEDCCGEQGPHWGTAADEDSST